jgi:hypothetical protein
VVRGSQKLHLYSPRINDLVFATSIFEVTVCHRTISDNENQPYSHALCNGEACSEKRVTVG